MKVLIRIVIALLVVAGFSWLFLRTARDTRSEPYLVDRTHLQRWTIQIEPEGGSSSPMLVARPPQELSAGLFQQIFSRMMESMRGSTGAGVPLILRGEYELSLAGSQTPQSLVELARAAGLEGADLTPRCMAVRRISQPGLTRQLYYVLFDSPAFQRFRDEVARASNGTAAIPFDPAALAPIMIVAATDAAFDSWLPIGANASADCIAPVEAR